MGYDTYDPFQMRNYLTTGYYRLRVRVVFLTLSTVKKGLMMRDAISLVGVWRIAWIALLRRCRECGMISGVGIRSC